MASEGLDVLPAGGVRQVYGNYWRAPVDFRRRGQGPGLARWDDVPSKGNGELKGRGALNFDSGSSDDASRDELELRVKGGTGGARES